MGNLGSVCNVLKYLSVDFTISNDKTDLKKAGGLILPGVGAFNRAVSNLRKTGLDEEIIRHIKKGKPFLGICLGLQLLFEESLEGGHTKGLSVIKGNVERFKPDMRLKIPHMGWNSIYTDDEKGFFYEFNNQYVYFVHSYFPKPDDNEAVRTVSSYGNTFTAAVERQNVVACQFHPEKSGATGLNILRKWADKI